ncbi:hypothetical protein JAAARDRAFT_70881 [Jaapia argillacea MUCL 33604]|uniref:acylaminoacyl-peptidase n=1 Tax=Jaapia argillacea MUCL 33604 TaxID=933084 RepID=A0A067PXN2_9AGAM|nr:hypothetical protein JAAARDRAFT_70881 [Jaapia argillacea MUCL 33604]
MSHLNQSSLYTDLAELPTYNSARFVDSNVIDATLSIKDHTRNTRRTVIKSIFLGDSLSKTVVSSDAPADVIASVFSRSGKRKTLLRETSDQGDGGKKRYVEVWFGDVLEASKEVTKLHGTFYSDDYLSTLAFSPSETALLYAAEPNEPDSTPYEKFCFVPNFGEGLVSKKAPTLFLFRWAEASESVTNLRAKPDSPSTVVRCTFDQPSLPVFLTQAVFATENRIFATGFEHTPEGRILGIRGCQNRPARIWDLSFLPIASSTADGDSVTCPAIPVSPPNRSCRSLRVYHSQSGLKIFWVSNEVGGAHASCASLHSLDTADGQQSVLIDTVWEPTLEGGFPGLYADHWLPAHPFLHLGVSKSLYIATSSFWGSRSTVLLILAENGSVKDLTPDTDGSLYSWSVLGTNGLDTIICSRSAPNIPYELAIGRFDANGDIGSWQVIDKPSLTLQAQKALSSLSASVIPIPNRHPVETILLRSSSSEEPSSSLPPCVVLLHGGPHTVTTTAFYPQVAALVNCGYTVSMPNYTGSLGFGETYVRRILGNCGNLDVEDCIASVRHLIKLGISQEGPGKQFVQGGSHGGFLAGHLIGQYPTMFSAAVIRNPVISVGESPTGDITDWYYAEFGMPFGPTTLMTPETYAKLHSMSPISHIDKITTPVHLYIGEDDQRVTPTQGRNFYYALKGRGKTVEMFCFPKESHPLDGVEAARVTWELGREWLDKYAKW